MTSLVTGGAGFVGTNLAHELLSSGEHVRILDNLSRKYVDRNAAWLQQTFGDKVDIVVGDVRDQAVLRHALRDVTHVVHLAAQVAVTTSLVDPIEDFEVNARGTLNVLEAVRAMRRPASVLFTSTNKVYGACSDVGIVREGRRYLPDDRRLRVHGVDESRPLDFHSPYGCAKGCADQYVLDWARTYGLRTCVLRMSCIYGPRQFGNEDQGWVAHFVLRALRGEPITLYGDGYQVRDVLFVEDLVAAMLLAREAMSRIAGQAFNVGGGPENAVSLAELLERLEGSLRLRVRTRSEPWRTADQRWYVSDIRKIGRELGWSPRVSVEEGLERLRGWALASGLAPAPLAHEPREASP